LLGSRRARRDVGHAVSRDIGSASRLDELVGVGLLLEPITSTMSISGTSALTASWRFEGDPCERESSQCTNETNALPTQHHPLGVMLQLELVDLL
jgi:hypothetical protein